MITKRFSFTKAVMLAAVGVLSLTAPQAKGTEGYLILTGEQNEYPVAGAYDISKKTTLPIFSADEQIYSYNIGEKTDGNLLLYTLRFSSNGPSELYATDLKKGARTKLSGSLTTSGTVSVYESDDKNKLAFYIADKEEYEKYEMYYTSTKKSKPVKLNASADPAIRLFPDEIRTLPNGKGAFFWGYDETVSRVDLYLSMTKESAPRLIYPSAGDRDLNIYPAAIHPQSKGLIYYAGENIFYYDIKTMKSTQINQDLGDFGLIMTAKFDPKGKTIVYTASYEFTGKLELYSYDIAKGTTTKLSQEMDNDRSVGLGIHFDPKGKQVYYSSDKETTDVQVLYAVDLKKKTTTPVSDPSKDLMASGVDKAGNVYMEYFDFSSFTATLYKKPAKKGDAAVVLYPEIPEGLFYDLEISPAGLGAHVAVYDFEENTEKAFYHNFITKETLDISTFPNTDWARLAPAFHLEPTRGLR